MINYENIQRRTNFTLYIYIHINIKIKLFCDATTLKCLNQSVYMTNNPSFYHVGGTLLYIGLIVLTFP